jgi:hypothetical protein
MRNYSIKFILFLVAFTIGTIAVFLFFQKKLSPIEVKDAPDFVEASQLNQQKAVQTSLLSSLSFDGDNHGCGNFIAYKSTKDNTKVIGIRAEKNSLTLGKIPKTFDIDTDKNLEVFLYDFGKERFEGYGGLCFDAISVGLDPIELTAKSGKATISISTIPKDPFYKVTIILENVTFQTPNKNTINLERIEIKDVTVGFLMG